MAARDRARSDLSINQFSGKVPSFLGSLSGLLELYVRQAGGNDAVCVCFA